MDRTIRPKWPMPIKFGTPDPDDKSDLPAAFYAEDEWCEVVVERATETQARDFDSGELLSWPSGDPMMIAVLGGATARDGEQCSLFMQGQKLTQAFTAARLAAEIEGVAYGDTIRVRWHGSIPTVPRAGKKTRASLSPTKLYEVELIPAT